MCSTWRDFCETLDDSDRLLADVYKWLDSMTVTALVFSPDRRKAEELKTSIAEHLGIK